MIVLLFVITLITFIIFYVLPSADPAVLRAGRQPSPELIESIRQQLGLADPEARPVPALHRGHLASRRRRRTSATRSSEHRGPPQILDRLPATISLTVGAVILWLLIAIPIGIISAVKTGSLLDRATMGLALIAISAPVYWLGLVALYLFDEDIGQFPLLPGSGTYQDAERLLRQGRSADHAVVRARRVVRGDLRALPARQPDRGDGGGLHPHGARQGPVRAARGPAPRRALGDHADRDAPRPRPRRSCSAARS